MRPEDPILIAKLLAVSALALIAVAPARADEDAASITVMGTGQVSAAPDMAEIGAGVVTEAPRATDAVKANAAAMQKVFAALDAAGIERKHVQTSRFDVSPVYADGDPQRRTPPAITGYRAANHVQVEVLGVDKVGAVTRRAGRRRFEPARRRLLRDHRTGAAPRRRAPQGGRRRAPQGGAVREGGGRHARSRTAHRRIRSRRAARSGRICTDGGRRPADRGGPARDVRVRHRALRDCAVTEVAG